MMSFLKNFFAGDKTADEQAILAANALERQRDVLVVDANVAQDDEEEADEQSCDTPKGGCGGCGCG